ncbi:MAG: response regulator transcription factor [Anaerolineaceae bacterium]|nr:response regulator transcription factor [Anaerolineaceae bacterium]
MIRLLICDDQTFVCEGLKAILSTAPDIEVVGFANNGEEAVQQVELLKPELVLMDLKMPGVNGIQATRTISQRFPDVHVLVLTTYDFDEWVFDAIRAGAQGYLLKDTPREQLFAAIRGTVTGKSYIDPTIAPRLLNQISGSLPATPNEDIARRLSERELEVLRLLAQGLTNPEIAAKLFLSEGTVKNYVSAIFTKIGVADRTQATIFALRNGLAKL